MNINNTRMITVIGGANVDIVARYNMRQTSYSDSYQGQISTSAGGVARNIAENLAWLGHQVRLICAIGDDDLSNIIHKSLKTAHIDISACKFCENTASDNYLSLLDKEGELLHAVNQMRLVDQLTVDYLKRYEPEILASERIIADCNLTDEAIAWLVSLEDRPNLFFDGVSSEKILKLKPHLGRFEGLKCNEKEAAKLMGLNEAEAAKSTIEQLTKIGLKTAILSRGQEGMTYAYQGNQISTKPKAVQDTPVSVSGAGDALFAGIIHGQLHGLTEQQAAEFGHQAAALTLSCAGAVNPDLSKLIT